MRETDTYILSTGLQGSSNFRITLLREGRVGKPRILRDCFQKEEFNKFIHNEYGPAIVPDRPNSILKLYFLFGKEYKHEEWKTQVKQLHFNDKLSKIVENENS